MLINRGAKNSIIFSRMIILSLLITALAGPYDPVPVTQIDPSPSVIVLSDETSSMDIYVTGAGQAVYGYLEGQTPVSLERMRGLRSNIGDRVLSGSAGMDHIVVVSDGNNNFGSDLGETIDFISNTGTSVYAVTRQPESNDLSVEITGARTAVLGNENLVGIEVRQALADAEYLLSIQVDGKPVYEETLTQMTHSRTIGFSNIFYSLGPHVITASISSGDDVRPDNNVFNKTVYVVPKPRILLITSDAGSPMSHILKSLYDLDIYTTMDDVDPYDYKAVVLDNLNEGWVSNASRLREYAAGGGGLVVVGGDNSYDFGDYLDSELETILPVDSYASSYAGSVNVVIVLDISGSISAHEALDDEKAMAIKLLMEMGRDTNAGVVAFGGEAVQVSDGLLPMSVHTNREALIDRVSRLGTGLGGTSIDQGISTAADMLDNTSGQKYMLVFSDSAIKDSFEKSKTVISSIDTQETKMIFTMIRTNVNREREIRADDNKGDYFLKVLADQASGDFYLLEPYQRPDLKFGREPAEAPPDGSEAYPVVRLDEEHFITRYLNISGSISGFNDVTQKVGASRLVTTSMGKPVVTSWQFGLGRVVSLSTDNGNLWAGALYSAENARLLPSIINWAVGDPTPADGLVVYSSDMNLGSPGTLTIHSNEIPEVVFNSREVPVVKTQERTYEGTLDPVSAGVFPLSVSYDGSVLDDLAAVNYPVEYRDVGNNPQFLEAVRRNGGGIYDMEGFRTMLFGDIQDNSVMTTVEKNSLQWPFLLAALLIFLGEVTIRRAQGIIDIKMRRKSKRR